VNFRKGSKTKNRPFHPDTTIIARFSKVNSHDIAWFWQIASHIISETIGGGYATDATQCDHSLSLSTIYLRPITASFHKTTCRP